MKDNSLLRMCVLFSTFMVQEPCQTITRLIKIPTEGGTQVLREPDEMWLWVWVPRLTIWGYGSNSVSSDVFGSHNIYFHGTQRRWFGFPLVVVFSSFFSSIVQRPRQTITRLIKLFYPWKYEHKLSWNFTKRGCVSPGVFGNMKLNLNIMSLFLPRHFLRGYRGRCARYLVFRQT